jgi:hypothetical protein
MSILRYIPLYELYELEHKIFWKEPIVNKDYYPIVCKHYPGITEIRAYLFDEEGKFIKKGFCYEYDLIDQEKYWQGIYALKSFEELRQVHLYPSIKMLRNEDKSEGCKCCRSNHWGRCVYHKIDLTLYDIRNKCCGFYECF